MGDQVVVTGKCPWLDVTGLDRVEGGDEPTVNSA